MSSSGLPSSSTPSSSSSAAFDGLRPALFFLSLLYAVVIIVLAVAHRPYRQRRTEQRYQTRTAYAFISLLAVLCTISGVLLLTRSVNQRAKEVVEALLSLSLGVPVVHLPQLISGLNSSHKGGRLLFVLLSSVTCVSVLAPFIPQIPTPVSPILFLIYSFVASLRLSFFLSHFYHSPNFSVSDVARPIAIHVATHRSNTTSQHFTLDSENQRHQKAWSVDSTATTVTVVDQIEHITFPPPEALALPPPTPSDVEFQPTTPSGTFDAHTFHLRTQVIFNRTRNLLSFLLAAQICDLGAYACAIAASVGRGHSSGPSYTTSPPLRRIQILQVLQTACTVVSIVGTMSAYLLHAYNAHVGSWKVASLLSLSSPFSKPKRESKKAVSAVSPDSEHTPIHLTAQRLNGTPMAAQIAPSLASPLHPSSFPTHTPSGRGRNHYRRDTSQRHAGVPDKSSVSSPTAQHIVPPTRPAPIVLTYQPPKAVTLSDSSLFESTDEEAGERAVPDPDVDDKESARKSLSNAHSFTSMRTVAAATCESEVTKVECAEAEIAREEQAYGYAKLKKGQRVSHVPTTLTTITALTSTTTATTTTTSAVVSTGMGSSALVGQRISGNRRSKGHRRKKYEDPALYITRRGSIPEPPKKIFGGLSWSTIGLHCMASRSNGRDEPFASYAPRRSASLQESSARASLDNVDSSWIDLEARGEGSSSIGILSAFGLGEDKDKDKDFRKSKWNTPPTPAGSTFPVVDISSSSGPESPWDGGPVTVVTTASVQAQRKLKKRFPSISDPSSQPATAEIVDESGQAGSSSEAPSKFIRVDVETRVVSDVIEQVEIVPLPKKVAAVLGEQKRLVKKPIASSTGVGLRSRRGLREGKTANLTLGKVEKQALNAYATQSPMHPRHPFSAPQEQRMPMIEDEPVVEVVDEQEIEEFRRKVMEAENQEGSRSGSPTPMPTPTPTPRKTKFPNFLKSTECLPPSPIPVSEHQGIGRRIMSPPYSPPIPSKVPAIFANSVVSSPATDEQWPKRASSALANHPSESLPPPPRRAKPSTKQGTPAGPIEPTRAPSRKLRRPSSSSPNPSRPSSANQARAPEGAIASTSGQKEVFARSNAIYAFGGEVVILEDENEGDFTNLRDPFASAAPPLKVRKKSGSGDTYEFTVADSSISSRPSSEDPHSRSSIEDVLVPRGAKALRGATRMSAWGRLPTAESSPSDASRVLASPSSKSFTSSASSTSVRGVAPRSRRHKDKRSKRSSRSSRISRTLDDDAVEEALLAQRLLKRLDGEAWSDMLS